MLQHDGQPATLTSSSALLNDLFTFVYFVEILLKIMALSPQKYWKDPWNRFDFLVVLGSLPGMFGLVIKPGASVFRTFRLWRMFRMLKDGAGLRAGFMALLTATAGLNNCYRFCRTTAPFERHCTCGQARNGSSADWKRDRSLSGTLSGVRD